MANCKHLKFICLALVTLTCGTVVLSQVQPFVRQQGDEQQLLGDQLPRDTANRKRAVEQQQAVGGQQLPGQQGLPVDRRADAAPLQGERGEPVQSNNLKFPSNDIKANAHSADLRRNPQNAMPLVQDSAQKNVLNFQEVNVLKQKIDTQQDMGQPKALPAANSIPNLQADSKLASKRKYKAKNELKQNQTRDAGLNTGNLVQGVAGNDIGVNNHAKIPDLLGDKKDSIDLNREKVQHRDTDFQEALAAKQAPAVANISVKAGARGADQSNLPDKAKSDNQLGNRNYNINTGDIKVVNKSAVDKPADKGVLPGHIKFIDGEVEKNVKESNNADDAAGDVGDEDDAADDADVDEDDDYYGKDIQSDTKVDSDVIKAQPDNEIPRNVDAINVQAQPNNEFPRNFDVNNMQAQPNNEIPRIIDVNNGQVNKVESASDKEKEGSMKVVWDWSDFAVNFEQYVMPEQKIRRAPHSSTGEPWPLPQYYVSKKDKVYTLNKANFRFKFSKVRCDIIEKAVERYKFYIFEDAVEDAYDNFQHAQSTMFEDPSVKYELPLYLEAPYVTTISIKIRKPCAKFPHAKMDESYDLFVKRTGVHLWANEVWGALRGLETFSQLVFKGTNQQLYVRDTVINDYPRFSHRGVMIDSARHFIFKETIYDALEGMAQNKMNVMHWHLVDDQSFPFYSQVYPDLSAKGAFHPSFVYMPDDIADIIEFARVRGIRVEPEFDTPGHTYSWGLSRPDLLTQCYQGDRPVDGYVGPMDPSKNETFRFLSTFFKDVLHVFKDQYIHLGGDEVPMTCWQSNPDVVKFLGKLTGQTGGNSVQTNDPYYYSYDVRKLLEYYVTRMIKDLKAIGSKRSNGVRFVFWQEIMNNDVQLPNDTIIHVWQGGMEDVQRAISLGLNVIYSTCWYLDLIEYGTKWAKYYQCDPADTSYGFSLDESKVLGGEACLWAEYIDNENLMTTLWPRASAAAERLWSSKDVRDLDAAATRLQEHRCRMLSRGLGVGQISGPDYCLRRGKRRHLLNETSANCSQSTCAVFNEKGRVEVEKFKVEFEQKGGRISDCSQAVLQAGSQLTLFLLLFITIAVVITIRFSKQKILQVRMCRNKTILMVFVTLILIYFMCYTSVWMQAMQFKGSFEKSVSSNVS